jgi:hypothetical protein
MKLLNILAEALSAEKEAALRAKFVNKKSKDDETQPEERDPNKISDKEFKALLDIDETPNGNYLNWIIPRYAKLDRTERKRFFEDGHNEEVKSLLPFFDRNKQRIKKLNIDGFQADINLYKTLRDFENIISAAKAKIEGEGKEQVEAGPEKLRGVFIAPITILGQTPSGFVVYKVPQTCKGDEACYKKYLDITGCGDPTQNFDPNKETEPAPKSGYRVAWCTRFNYKFNNYLNQGPYYLFKNWNTKRQYQLHYESGQLKDEADQEIRSYNSSTQKEFLQFLLDKTGTIPPSSFSFNLDLSKFKHGETEDGFPLYKVADKIYIDTGTNRNILYYYDTDINLLKTSGGEKASVKKIVTKPYMDLVKIAYKEGAKLPALYRVILNLDMEGKRIAPFPNSLDLSGSDITELPENLTIEGDLDLSGSKMKKLPNTLTVKGVLNISGLGLKPSPNVKAGKIIY